MVKTKIGIRNGAWQLVVIICQQLHLWLEGEVVGRYSGQVSA